MRIAAQQFIDLEGSATPVRRKPAGHLKRD
jgi:hypothetical protein